MPRRPQLPGLTILSLAALASLSAHATTLAGSYVEVNYDENGLPFDPGIPQGIRAYIGSTPAWYEFTFFDTTGTSSDIDPFVASSFYYEKGGTPHEYAGYAFDTTTEATVDWDTPVETDLSTSTLNSISFAWTIGDLDVVKTESWAMDGYAIFVKYEITNTSASRIKNFKYLHLMDPADTRSSASSTNTRNDVMDLDGDGTDDWAQALGRSTTTSTNNRAIGYGICDPRVQSVAFKDGVDVYISDVVAGGFESDPGGSSSNTQLTYLYTEDEIEAGDTIMFGLIVAVAPRPPTPTAWGTATTSTATGTRTTWARATTATTPTLRSAPTPTRSGMTALIRIAARTTTTTRTATATCPTSMKG